ncbi:hypothetical protein COP1_024372 [Malus domestica]
MKKQSLRRYYIAIRRRRSQCSPLPGGYKNRLPFEQSQFPILLLSLCVQELHCVCPRISRYSLSLELHAIRNGVL